MPNEPTGGERVDVDETRSRGARSVGFIWILAASLVGAVIVLAIILALFAGALSKANRRGGPRAIPRADAAQFHTPAVAPASPAG